MAARPAFPRLRQWPVRDWPALMAGHRPPTTVERLGIVAAWC
jgi:hypothetical protein